MSGWQPKTRRTKVMRPGRPGGPVPSLGGPLPGLQVSVAPPLPPRVPPAAGEWAEDEGLLSLLLLLLQERRAKARRRMVSASAGTAARRTVLLGMSEARLRLGVGQGQLRVEGAG